jgi:DUF1365 family protein
MHARVAPTRNVFRYPVYMTLIDLDELPELDRRLRLFGWNRRAPTSSHDADHLDVRALLSDRGIDMGDHARFLVLTNLRVLGYVFNPVSFWWCYREDGTLACIVAEVSNTFGERLPYVLVAGAAADSRTHRFATEKRLHVSPFMEMEQSYTWWLSDPGKRISVRMAVHEEGRPDFHATLSLHRVELRPSSLRAVLVRFPLMPARVLGRIHWQALRLLAMRVPFVHKPPFVPEEGTVRR